MRLGIHDRSVDLARDQAGGIALVVDADYEFTYRSTRLALKSLRYRSGTLLSMRLPGPAAGPGRLLPRIDYSGYVTGTLPMRLSQMPSSLKARMAPGWAFSSVSPSSIILSVIIAPSALSLRISSAYL